MFNLRIHAGTGGTGKYEAHMWTGTIATNVRGEIRKVTKVI
jgi:hypothetical protein